MISLAETTQVLGTRIWCLCRLLSQDSNNCQSSVKVSTGHELLITSQCRKPLGALRVYLRSANLKKWTTWKQNGRVPQLFRKEWGIRLCTYWICWNHVLEVTCWFADLDHCTMLEVKVSCWLIYYGCSNKIHLEDEWIFIITGSKIVLVTAVCNLWSLWSLQRVIQISMIGPSMYNCFLFIVKKTDFHWREVAYHAASSLSLQYVLQMCLKFWETEGICGCRLDCRWFIKKGST